MKPTVEEMKAEYGVSFCSRGDDCIGERCSVGYHQTLFDADSVEEIIAKARAEAFEEAAKLAESMWPPKSCDEIADAIRGRKS